MCQYAILAALPRGLSDEILGLVGYLLKQRTLRALPLRSSPITCWCVACGRCTGPTAILSGQSRLFSQGALPGQTLSTLAHLTYQTNVGVNGRAEAGWTIKHVAHTGLTPYQGGTYGWHLRITDLFVFFFFRFANLNCWYYKVMI